MNFVYLGKIVNTHGIKGELRIRSDFPYKDRVFVIGNNLIIDDKEYNIKSFIRYIVNYFNRSVFTIMDRLYLLHRFNGYFRSRILNCMLNI